MIAGDDRWSGAAAYESYMGRWSRPLARAFVRWLGCPRGADWLEVGCGTGALTAAICDLASPRSVVACDPSEAFVDHARRALPDDRVSFLVAGAEALPGRPRSFDWVASGLVLNFVAHPGAAIGRMAERLRPGGGLAGYVWDYDQGLEFLRCFWDEATRLDPAAADLDEGRRFRLCRGDSLVGHLRGAGLARVEAERLEIPTLFRDFEDYWIPFLAGTGPAPSYVASLSRSERNLLRRRLAHRMRTEGDGSLRLTAKAWAVRGRSR